MRYLLYILCIIIWTGCSYHNNGMNQPFMMLCVMEFLHKLILWQRMKTGRFF